MGEVYRAKDPRLGREVAIRVLPSFFSSEADRLRRFEREAKTISQLASLLPHSCHTGHYREPTTAREGRIDAAFRI
jgi:serine/threonine protein kinase